MAEFDVEVTLDAKCPKCGHEFETAGTTTVDIEPEERDEP